MTDKTICQQEGCTEPAAWQIRNYFPKGKPVAIRLGTTALLRCEKHGEEHREVNPFQGWERIR